MSHGSDLNSFVSKMPQTASSTEDLISQLLMGFVERNVAPQTIIDVFKAQVIDGGLSAQVLSVPTVNGLIELLTANHNIQAAVDLLLFLSARPGFPQFLSNRAAFGLVTFSLRVLPGLEERCEALKSQKIVLMLDSAIRRVLSPEISAVAGPQDRARVVNALKILPDNLKCRLASTMPSVEALKRLCVGEFSGNMIVSQKKIAMPGASPQDLLKSLLEIPEHTLAQKGVAQFRPMGAEDSISWKTSNLNNFLAELDNVMLSPFRRGFLTEWFFDGMLRETLCNENFTQTFSMLLKSAVDARPHDESVLKGILRAVQRDLSLTAIELNYPDSRNTQFVTLLQRASHFHVAALSAAMKNVGNFSRQFANWALQMPVHPEESRLFTRNTWQWIRVLATKQWEDDLREPPQWVVHQSNRFAATIVNLAPNFWLQDHVHTLIERLHVESLNSLFVVQQHHTDYVEFLCRTLRKKSPTFAARFETLLALRFLGRATAQEEGQLKILETRYRMLDAANDKSLLDPERQFWLTIFRMDSVKGANVRNGTAKLSSLGDGSGLASGTLSNERFGASVLTRALHVLLYTCRITARANGRSRFEM